MRVLVLSGGYGGARMAHGFALLGGRVELTVVVNTADDLELHGLHISPDLDTVMYTLAGLANQQTGWGVKDETWSASEMLERYGAPVWFRLGDRDLATHIQRTALLRDGVPLTETTQQLAAALGITSRLLPMTNDRVRTRLRTEQGWLDFQDYFVRRGHADEVFEVDFEGSDQARPTDQVLEAITTAELVVIAPSNPFVSVAPILALPEITAHLSSVAAPVLAISPIVGGQALRGPAAEMLRTLTGDGGSAGVARLYTSRYPGLLDVLVLDESDRAETAAVESAGLRAKVTGTVIGRDEDRRRLAEELIESVAGRGRAPARRTMPA